MPRLALAVFALWFVSLFVMRTVIQWVRTGSTGLKGFRGAPGSLPWLAGMSISAGLCVALAGPVAALARWPWGAPAFDAPGVHLLGAAVAVMGTIGALIAQLSMGDSWRVGVDESEVTDLVRSGLFAWVRNPIFSFMGLTTAGLLLLVPNLWSLAGGVLVALGIELQVRFVEEPHLARTQGASYADYAASVGRFVPGVGCLGEASWLPRGRRMRG
jgi:protein-S-isoprenylcysteine O-methyltransferase Ste14